MSQDLATLIMGVKSQDVVTTTKNLDGMTAASAKTEGATKKLTASIEEQAKEARIWAAEYAKMQGIQTQLRKSQADLIAEVRAGAAAYDRQNALTKQVTDSTRAISLAQAEAIKVNEAMGKSVLLSDVQFGRLRGSLTSLTAAALGAAPGLTQVGSVLSQLTLGAGATILVLAGAAGLAWAWDKVSSSARNAAKEQKDALQRLDDLGTKQRQGDLGSTPEDMLKAFGKAQALSKKLEAEMRNYTQKLSDTPASLNLENAPVFVAWAQRIDGIRKEYAHTLEQIKSGAKEIGDVDHKMREDLESSREKANKKEFDAQKKLLDLTKETAAGIVEESERMKKALDTDTLHNRLVTSLAGPGNVRLPKTATALSPFGGRTLIQQIGDDAKQTAEIGQNLVRELQRDFSQFFEGVFTDGLSSFTKLFSSIRDMGVKLFSDLAAAKITKGLTSAVGNTVSDIGTGAALGIGAAVGGIGLLVGAISGAASAARKAAEALKEFRKGLDDTIISTTGSATQQANLATGKTIEDQFRNYLDTHGQKGKTFGSYNGDLDGLLKGLDGLSDSLNTDDFKKLTKWAHDFVALQKEIEAAARATRINALDVRYANATGNSDEAFRLQQEQELNQAIRDGADAKELERIQEVQLAEAHKRTADAAKEAAAAAEALAENMRQFYASLSERAYTATGNTRAAEDARLAEQHRQERYNAQQQGITGIDYDKLIFVQGLEDFALQTKHNLEDQTKAINDGLAATNAALDAEIKTAQDALKINQAELSLQEKSVAATQRLFDSITQYVAGLSLNTSLTTLSPTQQLAEAKRQYASTLSLAQGGDENAGGALTDLANTLLNASHAVNASGAGYVSDFNYIQASLTAVRDQYGVQLTTEQQVLKELQKQSEFLQAQIDTANAAKEQNAANAAAAIAAANANAQRLIDSNHEALLAVLWGINNMAAPPHAPANPGLPALNDTAVVDSIRAEIGVLQAGFVLLDGKLGTLINAVNNNKPTIKPIV